MKMAKGAKVIMIGNKNDLTEKRQGKFPREYTNQKVAKINKNVSKESMFRYFYV